MPKMLLTALTQQIRREGEVFVQELSCQATPTESFLQCLWQSGESEESLHETLSAVTKREISTIETAPWQTAAGNAESGIEADDCIPINTMLANRHIALGRGTGFGIGEPGDKQFTISAGHSHAVCIRVKTKQAAGFKAGQSKAGSIGWQDETAATLSAQASGTDRALTAGCNGKGWKEDISYTFNTIDRPAVVFAQQAYDKFENFEKASTLKTCGGSYGGGSENLVCETIKTRYIVRRLTPTECARLQGFPDKWGHPDKKETLTDDEYRFWLEVRNTHAAINGKAVKEYTKEQMLTWYNKLHSDSAEYKMWGNGISLPVALYVLSGIAEHVQEDQENENEDDVNGQ